MVIYKLNARGHELVGLALASSEVHTDSELALPTVDGGGARRLSPLSTESLQAAGRVKRARGSPLSFFAPPA